MDFNFIDTIYQKNQTEQGVEELFYSMKTIEEKHWDNIDKEKTSNWTEIFSQIVSEVYDKTAIIEVDTGKNYTYEELGVASDKICAFIQKHIQSYQIGLNYHNSFLFIATLIGINKANRLAVLFNNREPKERQEELAFSSNTKVVFGNPIEGCEYIEIQQALYNDFDVISNTSSTTLDDPAFVIFTSGTTGKSKGALFSHRRMLGAGVAWSLRTAMSSEDNCYIPLPLYHGNGLAVALSSVFYAKATACIRIKYSTTHFFNDIAKYRCTHMCYIGELWRYILNTHKDKQETSLKVIFGNGLTKSLWDEVVNRYGIRHVVEHFGATEMPAGALTNWYNQHGFCGYLPKSDPLVQDMILADENYKEVGFNQSGEALFLVPSGHYRGYLDATLDAKKLCQNVRNKGDVWWKSGDLLKVNDVGFFTFVERLGDTFRYKGENVACVDVEEALRKCGTFDEVVVYGISLPHIDGKIGMASLVSKERVDLKKIHKELPKHLASHAWTYLIKVAHEIHKTTSTMKIQKAKLAEVGISKYQSEEIYILVNNRYQRIDAKMYEKIEKGETGL
jgi:fatty-acyl-CoA synthase